MTVPSNSLRPVPAWKATLIAYLVLQVSSAGALLAVFHSVQRLGRVLGVSSEFRTSWLLAFVVVPASFVPVYWAWHRWACRQYGRRPRAWRLAAELAFAANVIGGLLIRGIA